MNFNNLGSFAAHLATSQIILEHNAEKALEKVAKVIETSAKDKLGHYQDAVGPFSAWPRLAETTLAEHARFGVGDTPLILHGGLYGSIEHEVHGRQAVVGTKLDEGAYQEFGTETIPPRPFLGPAAFENKEKIEDIFGSAGVTGIMGIIGN